MYLNSSPLSNFEKNSLIILTTFFFFLCLFLNLMYILFDCLCISGSHVSQPSSNELPLWMKAVQRKSGETAGRHLARLRLSRTSRKSYFTARRLKVRRIALISGNHVDSEGVMNGRPLCHVFQTSPSETFDSVLSPLSSCYIFSSQTRIFTSLITIMCLNKSCRIWYS